MTLRVRLDLRLGAFQLDVAFDAGPGITAVFGPSGAGKTLTLRCVAGLQRPDSGTVHFDGRTLLDTGTGTDLPPQKRRIGYVFQHYALFPHLTVHRNVAFGIRHIPVSERRETVDRLLTLVGLDGLGERRPRELSGGQQQRAAIARALAPEPRLLLLDEPFGAVDMRIRKRLREELRRIHDMTGTPMVLVTHDAAEVRHLSDSVVLLDAGTVRGVGPLTRLLNDAPDPELTDMLRE